MKNQRIKININRTPLSSNEISDLQNFGGVMKGFAAVTLPFYKKWWFWGSGAAVVTAVVVAAVVWGGKTGSERVQQGETATAFIQPAFANLCDDGETFTVTSGRADTLQMPSGTRVLIPACPFVDEKGDEVKGQVQIRCREFTDGVDFAASGIPMKYDSAGKEYLFESAGMFQVEGFQNGTVIQVNPGCPLTIEQKTVSTDGKFNMYFLDTVNRKWEFIGKPGWVQQVQPAATPAAPCYEIAADDTIQNYETADNNFAYTASPVENSVQVYEKLPRTYPYSAPVGDSILNQLHNRLAMVDRNYPQAPVLPRKLSPQKQNFRILADEELYPELAPFANTIFEVYEKESGFSPNLYSIKWTHATIERYGISATQGDSALGITSYKIKLEKKYTRNKTTRTTDKVKTRHWWEFWNRKGVEADAVEGEVNDYTVKESVITVGDSIQLIPLTQNTKYRNLSRLKKYSKELVVYPVLAEGDYKNAMVEYEQKMAEYRRLLDVKNKLRKELQDSIAARNASLRNLQVYDSEGWKKQQEEWKRQAENRRKTNLKNNNIDYNYALAADSASAVFSGKVINSFTASKFGIYNCDYPFRSPNPVTLNVTFKNQQGQNQYIGNAYIIVANRNALMALSYNNCCNVAVNFTKTDRNIFFTVLPDGRIAYYTGEDFKTLPDKGQAEMKLRYSEKPMENMDEIRAYVGMNPKRIYWTER